MIFSRLTSIFLRFGEFVCAAVVLGLNSYFLHRYDKHHVGPRGREIYIEIISAISVLLSLIWLLPFTSHFMHYPLDFFISAAWFAAFGTLVNYIHKLPCGSVWRWSGLANGSFCSQWKAAEAFSFIGACFWLASALLGLYVYHKLGNRNATTDGTHHRRRWGRSRV